MSIGGRLEWSFSKYGLRRVRLLLTQPDFKTNPCQAVWRRVRWRLHWKMYPDEPVILNNWCYEIDIILPRSGSAAQIFYRDFSSPSVVAFMKEFLRRGMTVLDIGAHVGEYTLIAAQLVGSDGQVHAIEPQPSLAEIISQNAKLNRFSWIIVHPCAVTDHIRKELFTSDPGSRAGWLAEKTPMHETLEVQTTTLDHFCTKQGLKNIDFIKLDAAGNEYGALRGGEDLLTRNFAPALVVKLYHPDITWDRFGYDAYDIVRLLLDWNYQVYELTSTKPQPFSGTVQGYCVPLLATHERL